MKLLNAATGVTEHTDIKCQTSVAKLLIKLDTASSSGSTLGSVRMKADRVGQGQKTIIDRIALQVLAEACAFAEGFISLEAGTSGRIVYTFTIDLGDEGALPADAVNYLSLGFENLLAGDVLTVHALDVPLLDNTYIHYDPAVITGTTQEIPLDSATSLILPSNGDVESVQIEFGNKTIQYDLDELKAIARDTNDLVRAGGLTVKYGYEGYIRLDLAGAKTLKVTPSVSASQFYVWVMRQRPWN